MTSRQEKIRDRLYSIMKGEETIDAIPPYRCLPVSDPWYLSCKVTRILNYLHSKGVVIKVESVLPQVTGEARSDHKWVAGYTCAMIEVIKAGYTAVEPLIEEEQK